MLAITITLITLELWYALFLGLCFFTAGVAAEGVYQRFMDWRYLRRIRKAQEFLPSPEEEFRYRQLSVSPEED